MPITLFCLYQASKQDFVSRDAWFGLAFVFFCGEAGLAVYLTWALLT